MTANMSRGPLRRRLSGAPWISLGVSMLGGGGGAGGGVGVGLVHRREVVVGGVGRRWWEAPDAQECQVTGLGPPPPDQNLHFQKKIKCCSVPLGLVGSGGGWRRRRVGRGRLFQLYLRGLKRESSPCQEEHTQVLCRFSPRKVLARQSRALMERNKH